MPDKEFVSCPICRDKYFLTSDAFDLPNAFHLNSFLELRQEIVRIKKSHDKCAVHNQHLKTYCADCDTAVCNDCLVKDHMYHTYMSVPVAYAQSKIQMEEKSAIVNEDIEIFDKVVEKLRIEKTKVAEKAEECKNQIAMKMKLLIETLQENHSRLLEEINGVTEQKLLHLTDQENAALLVKAKLVTCQEYINESTNDWTQVKLLEQKTKVLEKVHEATKEIHPQEFEPLEKNDLTIASPPSADPLAICKLRYTIRTDENISTRPSHVSIESFATLKIKSHHNQPFPIPISAVHGHINKIGDSGSMPIHCNVAQLDHPGEFKLTYTIPERGLYKLAVSIGGVDILGSPFNIEVISRMENIGRHAISVFDKLKSPFAIKLFQDGCIVAGDRSNNALSLFHENGKLLNEIKFKSEEVIRGIAISPDDQHMLVTAGNRLLKVDRRGECLAILGFQEPGKAFSHFNTPKSIAVHPTNGMAYIIDSGNHRVQELRHHNLTRSKTLINDSAKKHLVNASDIAIDNEGYIYIADQKNCNIKKFSPDQGTLVSKIGSKGRKPGCLMEPTSLTILNQELYVGDSGNNRISIFNLANEQFLHSFPIPFPGDISVAVNHHGYIHVCTSQCGQVFVY